MMGTVFDDNLQVDSAGNLTIAGNLTVNGATTTINSTTLTVDDKVIVIASGAADSAAANGAGISVDGAAATILYDHNGTQWEMNKPLEVAGSLMVTGTTPTLTIGDAGAEDTMLVFDGNAQDYRIGVNDGTDTLEIGVGSTHGTTPAILVGPDAGVDVMGALGINSSIADETASGIVAVFTAGEALERGEVVYFKAADSKMWKAVATAAATSRCVAMAAEDISADAAGKFLLQGFVRDNGSFPAYTIGGTLYTPEAETSSQNVPEQAAPDTSGDFVQVIGWAVSADMVFFNPSGDVIEVA
jgi:hypothetical protein